MQAAAEITKNLPGYTKFSLTHLLFSTFHYFAFDATLTITIQLSARWHCEQSRTTSTPKTPNSVTKIILIGPFISDFINTQPAFLLQFLLRWNSAELSVLLSKGTQHLLLCSCSGLLGQSYRKLSLGPTESYSTTTMLSGSH